MKQKNSAIEQMMLGNRGSLECIPRSKEWKDALKVSVEKYNALESQLKDYPQLLTLFNELQEAEMAENAIHIEDVYKEAFAFGLAIGQEVFDN